MHPPEERRDQLRATFTDAAELYHRMRPSYPAAVFDELADFGRLTPGSRVLEIGCGTGQATRPLAERGYQVTAVELGEQMATIARDNLAAFPQVQVVVSAFEAWPLPSQAFDAVVSATAFHWLDPATRVTRCATALRPGGTLAVIGTHHVAGGDTSFFDEVQRCYETWDPSTPSGLRLLTADEVPPDTAELDTSGFFEAAVVHRYMWTETYSTAEYRDLLLTYSGHRALEPGRRGRLLDCITDVIETRYGGRVTKQYLTELTQARRLVCT
jgi:SAM-dependent methyltransferase